jgi:O-antigen/teichoic acid export membrane protein
VTLETGKTRRNSSLWLSLVLGLAAVACNFLFFLRPPAQAAIPWLSLALALAAFVFLGLGVTRLFGQPRGIAARIFGSVVALVSLIFAAGGTFGFYKARAVPASADAPQIGQTVPAFTLADSGNRPVTLAELLAGSSVDSASGVAPKAVLLIFYRGYW